VEWNLQEFSMPMGRLAISSWRTSLSPRRRADFDAFLLYLSKLDAWEYPDTKPLTGKQFNGLHELRWRSENVPHRIGGFYSDKREFAMLIGFTHNAKKYTPPDALKTLIERKKQIDRKEASLREYKLVVGN
jgi:hypothetical protein